MRTEIERDLAALAAHLRTSSAAVHAADGRGSGSGVVWSARTIVTNAHVATTRAVAIELADGRRLSGTVDRRDERRDLARIRVDADLTPARSRSPHDLRVGEFAAAFGHPLGVRDVLSTGIIFSAYTAQRDRFIEADLKLEPGNSGGALADSNGNVIGLNSMIAGGLALAIPADDVERFVRAPDADARLGVRLAPARLRDGRPAFAVIAVEPGSVAQSSHILVGDIIVTHDPATLGTARSLEILRGGERRTLVPVRASDSAAAA